MLDFQKAFDTIDQCAGRVRLANHVGVNEASKVSQVIYQITYNAHCGIPQC